MASQEWQDIVNDPERLARFKAGLRRAEEIVKDEPPLSDEQLAKIEAIFADARAEQQARRAMLDVNS